MKVGLEVFSKEVGSAEDLEFRDWESPGLWPPARLRHPGFTASCAQAVPAPGSWAVVLVTLSLLPEPGVTGVALQRLCLLSRAPRSLRWHWVYNQAQPLPQVPTAEAGQLASTSPSTSTYPPASSALPAASSLSTLPSSSSFGPASAPYTGKMVVSPAGMQVQAVPFICSRNKCGPFLKTNPSPPLIFLSAS